jgi:hypothetical protein
VLTCSCCRPRPRCTPEKDVSIQFKLDKKKFGVTVLGTNVKMFLVTFATSVPQVAVSIIPSDYK